MSALDNLLIEKYKTIISLNNILYTNNSFLFSNPLKIDSNLYVSNNSNINNNITFNSNLSVNGNMINNNNLIINSNLNISSNALLNNNLTITKLNNNNLNINSNINISGQTTLQGINTILSTLTVNNTTYLNNLNVNNIVPFNGVLNLNSNIINIGTPTSNIVINGTRSSVATNNLNVVDKLISLNVNLSTLSAIDIGNLAGIEILGTTLSGYIRTSNNGKNYELQYPNNSLSYIIPILDSNNNLYITGNTLLNQNSTLNSSLNISNNFNTFNLSTNSSINISNNSILGGFTSILSNLFILKSSILNNNNTILSNLVSNNLITNNLSINGLYVTNNSLLLGNTTILSSLNISNNTTIINNTTVQNSLYVSNNSFLNNVSVNSGLSINNNSYLNNISIYSNLYISSNCIINNKSSVVNNVNISGNSSIKGNLTVGSNLSLINVNSTMIIQQLPEYPDNISAANAGIPVFGFYRTGGVVKVRLSTVPPVITIIGGNNIVLNQFDTYVEYGATAVDNIYGTIPVTISGTVDTTTVGTYYIIYSAIDNSYNSTTVVRKVNVIIITYNTYEFSFSKIQINDPSQLTTGTNFIYNLFGLTSWTVEAWVNPTSYAGTAVGPIISLGEDQLVFDIDGGYVKLVLNYSTTLFTSTSTVPINTWSHIVWQRTNNNTFTIFINGITNFTGTILSQHISILNSLPNFPTKCVSLGRLYQFGAGGYCFNGKVYEPKISNTALYLSNFTPSVKLPLLSSTLFLLGGNNTELIVGSTASAVYGTVTSNTIMFTYKLTSTNACIGPIVKTNYFTTLQSNTNWTIEFYLNYTSTGGVTTLFVLGNNTIGTISTNTSLILVLTDPAVRNVSGQPYMTTYMYNNNSFAFGNDQPMYINTWYHCVFTRYNNNSYIIINGVWSNPISSFSGVDPSTWNQIYIGAPSNIFTVAKKYSIAQFKITNAAVYTNPGVSFTPPTLLTPSKPYNSNILFYLGDDNVDIINPYLSVPITGTVIQSLR